MNKIAHERVHKVSNYSELNHSVGEYKAKVSSAIADLTVSNYSELNHSVGFWLFLSPFLLFWLVSNYSELNHSVGL